MDREDDAIADAVAELFPAQAQRLRACSRNSTSFPARRTVPAELTKLDDALEQCVRSCRQTKPTVQHVKKHLDDAARRRQAAEPLRRRAHRRGDPRRSATPRDVATTRSRSSVPSRRSTARRRRPRERDRAATRLDRPWREIGSIAADLEAIRAAYVAERERLLRWQEQLAEQARGRVKARDGFSTLTADQAHHVLRPLD